jgi:hypothetical protein
MIKSTIIVIVSALMLSCECRTPVLTSSSMNETMGPDTIAGYYKTVIEEDQSGACELSVEIYKTQAGYGYRFKSDVRDTIGEVSLIRDDRDEVYLVFEGLPWDSYEGDITDEMGDTSEGVIGTDSMEVPVGVDAFCLDDTLVIQNYGNATNSYNKIGECDRKYIYLIRQHHQ